MPSLSGALERSTASGQTPKPPSTASTSGGVKSTSGLNPSKPVRIGLSASQIEKRAKIGSIVVAVLTISLAIFTAYAATR